MKKLIIKTDEDKCVGCNKCIFECPVNANSAKIVDDKNKISVNPDRCIQCGECIRVCDHGARSFCDDTEEFFERLKAGSKITVLAAPAVRNNFQDYKKLLGFLRKAGVNLIFDVSFGADIATWAYLKAIKERHIASMIAQPCPVIVSYIQMYNAELIPFLAPIHSPAMCAAIYLRKYKNITDELAFISPCIGKKV
ncbi:MAG: [Fe-Fe] hydrogenase large subunit C-terminal domain-containing protein, partial [Oscillospiraceae bacterium]